MITLAQLKRTMKAQATLAKAKASSWFFKTGPGQYGEREKFLGLTVPQQRVLAKKFRDLPLGDVEKLLKSPFHEHRLTAVLILGDKFRRADIQERATLVESYLRHTRYINNWDIVDSSAPHILGYYLLDKPKKVLYRLANSKNLWERRIAIIATQTFIRHGQFAETMGIAAMLLKDKEDLIHKAVGWMLREVGDQDKKIEVAFLKKYATIMPRTMLRYAIEKFSATERKSFLQSAKKRF